VIEPCVRLLEARGASRVFDRSEGPSHENTTDAREEADDKHEWAGSF
jgi:hypothetical protein